MRVYEEHVRELPVPPETAAQLVDQPERMWPAQWPPFRAGGFGFLQHTLEERHAGEAVLYKIIGPPGFSGRHGWTLESRNGHTLLRHTVEAECRGLIRFAWPLVIQPIHAAVHEVVLDQAETLVGGTPAPHPWSRRVRFLRWAMQKAGRARG